MSNKFNYTPKSQKKRSVVQTLHLPFGVYISNSALYSRLYYYFNTSTSTGEKKILSLNYIALSRVTDCPLI